MNIFERATRSKLRFPSVVGSLSLEQLWDLPLTSPREGKPSLDNTARIVHSDLKSLEEGSFVDLTPDPRKTERELQLEIVKHIIATKIADRAAAEKRLAAAQQKQKLLSALASKEEQALAGKSIEEIQAEIAKLDAA